MDRAILREGWMRARERLPTEIFLDSEDISVAAAREIADLVRRRQAKGLPAVLGLATGSTPMHVYRELVRMHREEGLSFCNVVAFNLDEYWPMQPGALQSYHRFMREHLFDHVDVPPAAVHIPDGTAALADVPLHCHEYEAAIEAAGGIDLQLLGLGRLGHIGFNEHGSGAASATRLVTLDKATRVDAASDFFGEGSVPRQALTMGIATILRSRRILLLAFGENKAEAAAAAVEGPVRPQLPASFLQSHPDATALLDYAAAARLTRVASPWTLGPVQWDEPQVKKAVCWLSREVRKPLLKLTGDDYAEHSLQGLVSGEWGPAHRLNLRVFNALQRTIWGWPDGKPTDEAAERQAQVIPVAATLPADQEPAGRVLVLSPHPDDDVISMGGTLIRLLDRGHEVHVAYQTSGNIAVRDEDALRFADFAAQFGAAMGLDASHTTEAARGIEAALRAKRPGEVDSEAVLRTKSLIRQCEARSAVRTCGGDVSNLHFLNMPFYQTGRVVKAPLGPADIALLVDLFDRIRPHQIYAAGDLSDPHGTHRTCLQAVFQALERVRRREWYRECGTTVLLYRGAWQEWEPWEADLAVPLSPAELQRKVEAIWKHQSQKDPPLFPGADAREFWQRAQDRNRATAALYNSLGLACYEGMEAFVRYDPEHPSPAHLLKPPRAAGV